MEINSKANIYIINAKSNDIKIIIIIKYIKF